MTKPYTSLAGKSLVILGFGSIGPAVFPLILQHIDVKPEQIIVIAADGANRAIAERAGAKFELLTVTPENYRSIFTQRLTPGSVLLNLSVHISSTDLIELCQQLGALYLDTSNEVWPSEKNSQDGRTVRGRREDANKLAQRFSEGSTALLCHGANPGIISHFAKQAVLDVGRKLGVHTGGAPTTQRDWALLARKLDIVSLHIAERDTQTSLIKKEANEYVNTWSVDGFMFEAHEIANFAWGTHEADLPKDLIKAQYDNGSGLSVELTHSSSSVRVRSWVPTTGNFEGFVIPHHEAFTLGELFSINENGHRYQPTVHFSYLPCDDAVVSMNEMAARGWPEATNQRILLDEIVDGYDELGILVLRKNSPEVYWFGSRLDITEARRVPNNNATSLQVAAGVLAGLIWIIDNPKCGVIEPEDLDFESALSIAKPYLGEVKGHWGNWSLSNGSSVSKPIWHFNDMLRA